MNKLIATIIMLLSTTGCSQSSDMFSGRNVGTLLGGAGGAWAGSNSAKVTEISWQRPLVVS